VKNNYIAFSLLIIHSFWMFILAATIGHWANILYSNWLLIFPILLIIIAINLVIPKGKNNHDDENFDEDLNENIKKYGREENNKKSSN